VPFARKDRAAAACRFPASSFLQQLDLQFEIQLNHTPVRVAVYYLPPATFGTAPLFLLSTDLPENDYLAQTITHKLYDPNKEARIAASILLGTGACKLLDLLGISPDIHHLNEAHALPLVGYPNLSAPAKMGLYSLSRTRACPCTNKTNAMPEICWMSWSNRSCPGITSNLMSG
jgi:hypothetical protein